MTAPTSHALFDLESPIRDLDNLASLTMQWAQARTFYLPDALEDEVTNQLRAREVDHRRGERGRVMNALFPLPVAAILADPVYAAIELHRQAYGVFMDVWDRTRGATDLYERAKTDKAAAAELRRFSELERAEESAFHTLLATRPTTKTGAIACVEHVADCGLATDEMRAWLAMLIESPLVAEPNSQRRNTR